MRDVRDWLIFRPGDRDFDLNMQVLHRNWDTHDCVIVFRHRADKKVEYVKLLGAYLAFTILGQTSETRVHVREIDRILVQTKTLQGARNVARAK